MAEIHVWQVDTFQDTSGVPPALSTEELAEAERFRHPADRRRYLVTRTALRTILAPLLEMSPASIPIRRLATGRPVVESPVPGAAPAFSVAHSER